MMRTSTSYLAELNNNEHIPSEGSPVYGTKVRVRIVWHVACVDL